MIIHVSETQQIDILVNDNSYRYRTIMGENSLNLQFSLAEHIEIPLGSWCEFEHERYELVRPGNLKKNHTRSFDYTLIMESAQAQLGKYKLRDKVEHRLKFSLTAQPQEHLELLVYNLNLRDKGWNVGECIKAPEKVLSYNHTSCKDALGQIAQAFNTEWEIEGKTIHLRKVEYYREDPLPLSYGKGNGFRPGVGRSNYDNSRPIELLYVQGGNRNIDPSNYGSKELLLPKGERLKYDGAHFEGEEGFAQDNAREYISDAQGYFIRRVNKELNTREEDSLDLSNIYPSRVGTVTGVTVTKDGFCDFFDTTIPAELDYSQHRIAGETASVIFQSGMLAGKQFDIHQSGTSLSGYVHAERRFELVEQQIDGQAMPKGVFMPKVGDKYAVFGISMPPQYVCNAADRSGASWEMFREAVKYLYENEDPRFSFTGEMDGIWAGRNWGSIGGRIRLGAFVRFTDDQFQTEGVLIRMTGIRDSINRPHSPTIELSNVTAGGSVSDTLKKIDQNEVTADDQHREALLFTKRRFRDSQETIEMLEKSMLNFSGAVNPVAVQTMMMLVGDESLQFEFVKGLEDTTRDPDYQVRVENGKLTAPAGYLRHMTLGVTSMSSQKGCDGQRRTWEMPMKEYVLGNTEKKYLYAVVSTESPSGFFTLSDTNLALKGEGCYNLLMGVLNSEYEGESSYVSLYGFTEILPGRITTDKMVSRDGKTYFDLEDGRIGGKIVFTSDSKYLDEQGESQTMIVGGKLSTGLINADQVIANAAKIADFNIQGSELVGENGRVVFQNEGIEKLASLLEGTAETLIPAGSYAAKSESVHTMGEERTLSIRADAYTDIPSTYLKNCAGMLAFSIKLAETRTISPQGYVCEETGSARCEVVRLGEKGGETVVDGFYLTSGKTLEHSTYLTSGAGYRIRVYASRECRTDWVERPADSEGRWPEMAITLDLSIQGPGDTQDLILRPSTPCTKIGTDGLFSYWSVRNYLHFSKDGGLNVASNARIASPDGKHFIAIGDTGVDMPGVLAGYSVYQLGSIYNRFGAKIEPLKGAEKQIGTKGIYDIPHCIGHIGYNAQVEIIGTDNNTYYVWKTLSKTPNMIRIKIGDMAGNPKDSDFTITLTGDN